MVRAKHRTRGDAEKEGVADLAGGSGDGDANGSFHGRDFNLRVTRRKARQKCGDAGQVSEDTEGRLTETRRKRGVEFADEIFSG